MPDRSATPFASTPFASTPFASTPFPSTPFPSTGPHGHRGRMRAKLLQRGPDALVDYELLEMLLFLGIARRDTKPLAKDTLNRFGSLSAILAAPPEALAHLGHRSASVLRLVDEAAVRLARAETQERLHLANWDRLTEHLDGTPSTAPWRTLYLNNRNRLLADEPLAGEGLHRTRALAARALELHATAVILVCRAKPGAGPGREGVALARQVLAAAPALAIQLHDCVSGAPGAWASLRQAGGLS